MEEIIIVLQQWAAYRKRHPASDFTEFCRFYLAKPGQKSQHRTPPHPSGPPDLDSLFMMTVSRSTLSFWVYMRIALRDMPLSSIESIMLCSALNNLGECRKSDLINVAMLEISTGTDILNRLIDKGLINQRIDPGDKRSKLLSLNPAGLSALKKCYKKAALAREIFLAGLTDDEKELVAQILNPLQQKHSRFSIENKGRTIEEIHALVVGKKKRNQ
jgi:DNA-binding MarR family transcriptional regulator